MAKPLSEKLAEMSVRAKKAEDEVAAAEKVAHDKVLAQREQSRAAVETAIKKVDQDLKSAGGTAAGKWQALKAKMTADLEGLKSNIAERRHERDVTRTADRAELLEWEASVAVDYALASIEQAELAVFDAMIGRAEADRARAS